MIMLGFHNHNSNLNDIYVFDVVPSHVVTFAAIFVPKIRQ